MLFCGPHGYDGSPIELLFSLLKSTDMNPEHLPLGKTSFNNVVSMVVERARQLKKSHLLLLWHHALKSAFEYLVFKSL